MNQVIDPADPEALDAIPVGPRRARTLAIAAAWIGVGLLVGLALWLFWTNVINTSGTSVVESYTAGDSGHVVTSARGQFKVELPTAGTQRVVSRAGGSTVVVESRPGEGYSFSVVREPQVETSLESYTATLDTAAGSLASQLHGEIVSQTNPVAFGNVALKDVVFRKGGEYYRNRLVLAIDRLYTVQAKVKGRDPAPFNRLWKSFKILGTQQG